MFYVVAHTFDQAKGVNWENVLCSRSLLEWVNSKNSMPVGGSSLVITNPIMGTKYKLRVGVHLCIPRSGQGLPKIVDKFWALSVFRLNLMLNHHVGRQPPEICIFIKFSYNVKILVKYHCLEYQINIFVIAHTPNPKGHVRRFHVVAHSSTLDQGLEPIFLELYMPHK